MKRFSLIQRVVVVAWLTMVEARTLLQQTDAPAGALDNNSTCVRHYPCDLCATNWLFVLAAGGRTGSTTALSMFNNVPGFELIGEHGGLLKSMRDMAGEVETFTKQPKTGAWQHNSIDMQYIRCNIQDLMKRLILGKRYGVANPRVIGFKELRYTTLNMMSFLSEVFPCARIVFPYRAEPEKWDMGKELAWVEHTDYDAVTQFAKRMHVNFPTTTAMLPVEHLSAALYNDILHGMIGVKGCRFSRVLHDNANGGYEADDSVKEDPLIEGVCDFSELDFKLSDWQQQSNKEKWHRAVEVERFLKDFKGDDNGE